MPRSPKKAAKKSPVLDSYSHPDVKRKNNPPVGLVTSQTDKFDSHRSYQYDPHIDPSLQWAGKAERTSFDVPNTSLHIHERIDPKTIARAFLKKEEEAAVQPSLFDEPINNPPLTKAVNFYTHDESWANRLIAGDSLLVMNSLLHKEGMGGKIQTIYIDPPYGIKYNSNFQPFTNKRDVKERDEDLPGEPEMIKAFRDTWEHEMHSYLTYLRDRLLLAKELLTESGSCFVQMNDKNVHHVRELMDEVFGKENFFSQIAIKKTVGLGSSGLTGTLDYIIWYSKDPVKLKFHELFTDREIGEGTGYTWVELEDGTVRRMVREEQENTKLLPTNARVFCAAPLMSSGYTPSCTFDFEFEGRVVPAAKYSWKTNKAGVQKLISENRIIRPGALPNFKMYATDYPVEPISNYWGDVRASDVIYVVQTANKVLQRCILMTTDPGDLVFDPTCGSGTTAYVAEQWGRRWITCDTSRVAITLAKQRLMTAHFDYYKLAHPDEGVRSGLQYKTVPHVTLGSVANEEPPTEEVLYDQPVVDREKVRCTGPFTVEAVPSVRAVPFDGKLPNAVAAPDAAKTGSTALYQRWVEELSSTGIRAVGGRVIEFARVGHKEGSPYIHAEGDVNDGGELRKANIVFGGEFGPLEQRAVELALRATMEEKERPAYLIFAAFQFDPEASKDIDQISIPGLTALKAQMNIDLLTEDLRKKRSSSQSYWLLGQPAIEVSKEKDGKYRVHIQGFDYYNPATGSTESGGIDKVVLWMLDTNYDERSILPTQVFFPQGDAKRDWTRLAKALNGAVSDDLIEQFVGDTSLPFSPGEHRKIAVKVIDNRGIESLVIEHLK